MRTATGLQSEPTWRPPAQELDQIIAPEAAVHNLPRVAVDPICLEHSLGYIQAIRGGMHLRTSVLQGVGYRIATLARVACHHPLRRRASLEKGRCPFHLAAKQPSRCRHLLQTGPGRYAAAAGKGAP